MDKAAKESERTILVLSPDFLGSSSYIAPEWAAAFARDPKVEKGLILPIKVWDCRPDELLAYLSRIDLVGLGEEEAKKALLAGALRERVKPKTEPGFPAQSQTISLGATSFSGSYARHLERS
jgi:hypothetical protein